MAKTPLFARLQRAFALNRRALGTGEPVLELAARDHRQNAARSRSRRRFLLGGAGAALTLPLSNAACTSNASVIPVAIIGGGLAGLHAAYWLRRRGLFASVFEGSQRLGGRIRTDRDSFAQPSGQHAELGGELIDSGHQTLLALADELGIALSDYARDPSFFTGDTYYLDGAIVSEADLLTGLAPIGSAIDRALAQANIAGTRPTYANDNGLGALDQLSISAWLDSIGASGAIRKLLELAYTVELGLDASAQSALNLLLQVSRSAQKLSVLGDADRRYTASVGMDAIIARLAAALDPNQVALEYQLLRIELRKDGRYLLSFDNGRQVSADRLLITLPFSVLRKVELLGLELPAAKQRAIAELGYGTHAKLIHGFSSRPWRVAGNGSSYSDLGYQSSWETSRQQDGADGILVNFAGGQRGLDADANTAGSPRTTFLGQIDQIFPGTKAASTGVMVREVWSTNPYTVGTTSVYKVGQWTAFGGAEYERVGKLLFAGEHTSAHARGTMEGAAASGAMAAQVIGNELALPSPRNFPIRTPMRTL